jgi:hypothetical protein
VFTSRRGLRAPLAETVEAIDAGNEQLRVGVGWPEDRSGWTSCDTVDARFVAVWEDRIATYLRRTYRQSHPMSVTGFMLDWYAAIPGVVGGACFRRSRRVPQLGPGSLAFHRPDDDPCPDAVALLDLRFWCLPDDPDADHPDASVVPDERTLAATLRAQVRTHADHFLAQHRGARRLPRRQRLGAFFDALDTGLWYGGDHDVEAAGEVLRVGAVVLPGSTKEFAAASSLHILTDARGRSHLSRRRVGCCYYFHVALDRQACTTCSRVDDAARAIRYSVID